MQRWANKIWTSPSSFYPTVTLWLLLRRQCLKVCYYCEGRLLSLPFSMAIRDPYKQFNLPLDILALCTKWNLVFGNKKTYRMSVLNDNRLELIKPVTDTAIILIYDWLKQVEVQIMYLLCVGLSKQNVSISIPEMKENPYWVADWSWFLSLIVMV